MFRQKVQFFIFDFQNDGLKDIFISNGIYRDLTNQDFLQFVTQDEVSMRITAGGSPERLSVCKGEASCSVRREDSGR